MLFLKKKTTLSSELNGVNMKNSLPNKILIFQTFHPTGSLVKYVVFASCPVNIWLQVGYVGPRTSAFHSKEPSCGITYHQVAFSH